MCYPAARGGGAGFDTRAGQAHRETCGIGGGSFVEWPEFSLSQYVGVGMRTRHDKIGGHHEVERRAGRLAERRRDVEIAADHCNRSPAECWASRRARHAAGLTLDSEILIKPALLAELSTGTNDAESQGRAERPQVLIVHPRVHAGHAGRASTSHGGHAETHAVREHEAFPVDLQATLATGDAAAGLDFVRRGGILRRDFEDVLEIAQPLASAM